MKKNKRKKLLFLSILTAPFKSY